LPGYTGDILHFITGSSGHQLIICSLAHQLIYSSVNQLIRQPLYLLAYLILKVLNHCMAQDVNPSAVVILLAYDIKSSAVRYLISL